MAKTVSSSLAVRNAPQPKVHRHIDAFFGDDFGRLTKLTIHSANGFAKKKLDGASQALQVRTEKREKRARLAEARENRAAERELQAEIGEADRRIRRLFRRLKTRLQPDLVMRHKPPQARPRLWPYAATALAKYDGPILDGRGHRGVFARFRYYSRRTAEKGVSQRVVKYVFHGSEVDQYGVPYQFSNVGRTIDETLCAFDHLEQINWSAAKNAKLMMHGILAVDYRQTPDEMMSCGIRWAEESLGRFDLPYLVTLHAPPPDGDERNWHLHVLWSFRPLVRTGDFEWEVGEMLRTDLDNPHAMKLMREMFAAVMTEMSFEAGQRQIYTAKSNADRRLPHEPQVHLGSIRTSLARDGKYVAANEENHERVLRSKAAVLDDDLRHADEDRARQQVEARGFVARWMRSPIKAALVPQRIAAPAMFGKVDAPAHDVMQPADPIMIAHASMPSPRAMPAEISHVPAALDRKSVTIAPPLTKAGLFSLRSGEAKASRMNFRNFGIPVVAPIQAPLAPSAIAPFPPLARAGKTPIRIPVGIAAATALPSTLEPTTTAVAARAQHFAPRLVLPALAQTVAPISIKVADLGPLPISPHSVRIAVLPSAQRLRVALSTKSDLVSLLPLPKAEAAKMRALPRVMVGVPLMSDPAVPIVAESSPSQSAKMRVPSAIAPVGLAMDSGVVADILVHIDEIQLRDDKRRKERAAAKMAREVEKIAADRRLAVSDLLIAIEEDRYYVSGKDRDHTVDDIVLARFEVSSSELADARVQQELAVIADRQAAELRQIDAHVRRFPSQLRKERGYWLLDDEAPDEMRELVAGWGNDPTVQAMLERLAWPPPAPQAGSSWRFAREARERSMREAEASERGDHPGIRQPGLRIAGPDMADGAGRLKAPGRPIEGANPGRGD